jgi:hypothetical protein
MLTRTLLRCVAAAALLGGLCAPAPASADPGWSAPASLSACPAAQAPQVVFPSDSPTHATGWGAIVWEGSPDCAGGAGARVARIGADDAPGPARIPSSPAGRPLLLAGPLTAGGGTDGRIVIAGSAPAHAGAEELLQGYPGGSFVQALPGMGAVAPWALANAYLGDAALADAAPAAAGALQLSLERHYASRFADPARERLPAQGPVHALTVALDYRSEALLVWQQAGWLWARDVPGAGTAHRARRLARATPAVSVAALLSDDDRAIVAWSQQLDGYTNVYLDRSAPGVSFGAPQLLERFADPPGAAAPAVSTRLVRLSSESVMMAWAGAEGSRRVVRVAAVDLHGLRTVRTIAPPGGDALLAGLAPGPEGEAIVLWTQPATAQDGTADVQSQAIFAARGFDAYPGLTYFEAPEQVAPQGPNSAATLAVDPGTGAAVAVWLAQSQTPAYAIRSPGRAG